MAKGAVQVRFKTLREKRERRPYLGHNTPIILNQRVAASMGALKASQNNIGVKLAGYSAGAASLSPRPPRTKKMKNGLQRKNCIKSTCKRADADRGEEVRCAQTGNGVSV